MFHIDDEAYIKRAMVDWIYICSELCLQSSSVGNFETNRLSVSASDLFSISWKSGGSYGPPGSLLAAALQSLPSEIASKTRSDNLI